MIVYHALAYLGAPALALPAMPLITDEIFTNDQPDPVKAAALAPMIPAGWVVIDNEDGINGGKYSVARHGAEPVRAWTLAMRLTIEAMKRANPRLYFAIYGAHWTDQNGPLFNDQSDPLVAQYKAEQTAWNGPINKSRSFKAGTGLLSRLDATVINLYASPGQADQGRGLVGIVTDNAEVFRTMGRPRMAFLSPERPSTQAEGDARFVPAPELITQLDACLASGIEIVVLWGGYAKDSAGAFYRINWSEWPASIRTKVDEWLRDHGRALEAN